MKKTVINRNGIAYFLMLLMVVLAACENDSITLSQGVPLESVCKMMGHKDISTTQLYAKLTRQKVNEDIKRISTSIKAKYEIPEWNRDSDNVKNIHYGQREQNNQYSD